jgi:hypothetical protein
LESIVKIKPPQIQMNDHRQRQFQKYQTLFKTHEGFDDILDAHDKSGATKDEVKDSQMCGCFHCEKIYPTKEAIRNVENWAPEHMMICPYCGIDAVLCDNSGYPITLEFLQIMRLFWFSCK